MLRRASWGVVLVAGCTSADLRPPCPTTVTEELRVCAAATTMAGIDVSTYQGTINWGSVAAAGKTFAIARVSDGTTHLDNQFQYNWPGIRGAGMVRGVYQYFRASQSATAQADVLINGVTQHGGWDPADLPPVMDIETADGQTNAVVQQRAQEWATYIEAHTGRHPLIYTGNNMSAIIGTSLAAYPLWVANWGVSCPNLPAAWTDWQVWQDSATGSVSGISGDVDTDVFNGNRTTMDAFIAASMTGGYDAGPPPAPCTRAEVTASTLNVRPQPDTTQAPVGTLSAGDQVDVLETVTGEFVTTTDQWYHVQTGGGLTGFISAHWATCLSRQAVDGGATVVDAGVPLVDAGEPVVDAGKPVVDAGVADAGTVTDAGSPATQDAGAAAGDGVKEANRTGWCR